MGSETENVYSPLEHNVAMLLEIDGLTIGECVMVILLEK